LKFHINRITEGKIKHKNTTLVELMILVFFEISVGQTYFGGLSLKIVFKKKILVVDKGVSYCF